jgi:hypothetical protein
MVVRDRKGIAFLEDISFCTVGIILSLVVASSVSRVRSIPSEIETCCESYSYSVCPAACTEFHFLVYGFMTFWPVVEKMSVSFFLMLRVA